MVYPRVEEGQPRLISRAYDAACASAQLNPCGHPSPEGDLSTYRTILPWMAQETQYCSLRYILGTVYSEKTEASEISPVDYLLARFVYDWCDTVEAKMGRSTVKGKRREAYG